MTAIKKKVKVTDAVEEDFLTASSDDDTQENAPGMKLGMNFAFCGRMFEMTKDSKILLF